MALNAYQIQIFYHYILKNQIYLTSTQDEFFENKNIKTMFALAKEHAMKYKVPPTKEQMIELVRIKGLDQQISNDVVAALYNSEQLLNEYDEQWLSDNAGSWIMVRNAELAFRKGAAFFKTTNVTVENAKEVVENLKHMMTSEMSLDFSFQMGSDFFDPAAHLQERLDRTPTGYPFIDKCLKGGWWKGALICLVAGPKAGKSLWLQNLAAHSVLKGHNSAYITCELQEELVNMRIGSNMLNINIDEYEEKSKDQDMMRKKLNDIKNSFQKPGALRVKEFPSGASSVNDIRAHLLKEQEILGIKFENVFIDYINLIKNWRNPNSENLYIKIKQISEDLRAMAMEEGWAVITVTQLSKANWENENFSATGVSESGALIMNCDAIFGIQTSPELKAQGKYYLKYLADRVSGMENTRKEFNVDFKLSRIEENMSAPIEDMASMVTKFLNTDNAKPVIPAKGESITMTEIKEFPNDPNSLFPRN